MIGAAFFTRTEEIAGCKSVELLLKKTRPMNEEKEFMSIFVSKFLDATNNVERTKLELIANNDLNNNS